MSVAKGKVFRASCCFIVKAHFCASKIFFVCSVIFWMKMTHLWLGIGAKVSILVSRLHPKNLISKAYANYTKTDKAEGLVVVSKGPKSIHQEGKVIIIFCHPPKGELTEEFKCWAIHHLPMLQKKGMTKISSPHQMMVVATILVEWMGHNQTPTPCKTPHKTTLKTHKPMKLCKWRLFNCLIRTLQHWTLMMQTLSGKYSLVWLTMTINHCLRIFQHQPKKGRMPHNSSQPGSILGIAITVLLEVKACLSFYTDVKPTIQQLFEMFFFKPYVEGIIIPQTNICLQKEKHHPVSSGEFLHWLGLWFLMATINGPDHTGFWSMGEVDCFIGAPLRLGSFMSRKQFEVILKALAITARQPPAFRDRFWEVQEIIETWNANMTEQFTPSWASCLDESMSTWMNKYSSPGWMFVP